MLKFFQGFFQVFFLFVFYFPVCGNFLVCDWRQVYSSTLKIIFLLYLLTGWGSYGNPWDWIWFVLLYFFSFRKIFWTSELSTWSILWCTGYICIFVCSIGLACLATCVDEQCSPERHPVLTTQLWLCLCNKRSKARIFRVVGKIWGDRKINAESCADRSVGVCLPIQWMLYMHRTISLPNAPCVIPWIRVRLRLGLFEIMVLKLLVMLSYPNPSTIHVILTP